MAVELDAQGEAAHDINDFRFLHVGFGEERGFLDCYRDGMIAKDLDCCVAVRAVRAHLKVQFQRADLLLELALGSLAAAQYRQGGPQQQIDIETIHTNHHSATKHRKGDAK